MPRVKFHRIRSMLDGYSREERRLIGEIKEKVAAIVGAKRRVPSEQALRIAKARREEDAAAARIDAEGGHPEKMCALLLSALRRESEESRALTQHWLMQETQATAAVLGAALHRRWRERPDRFLSIVLSYLCIMGWMFAGAFLVLFMNVFGFIAIR